MTKIKREYYDSKNILYVLEHDKIFGVDLSLPNKGIASDTCGNVSATKLRNTVSDRRIVTPRKIHKVLLIS